MIEYKYLKVKQYADVLTAEFIIFHGGMAGVAVETARQLRAFAELRALINPDYS